jgi:glutamyl/glutaminyl-tRNA synthetase
MPTPSADAPLVTRFAPSPTGHLHVGGARTALFCWAFAKRQGGRFLIRIEDTDQARSSDESARGILDDLAWLGITWDDGPTLGALGGDSRPVGPYFQAQRLAIYNAYIEHLVRLGRAYPAFETSEQLEADRKAAAARKATYKYPRPADVVFGVFNAERWARAQRGEAHVVRFAMPDSEVRVEDQVLGTVKFARGEVDDLVIRKADGFPTYHFAVVIDDELMGVTHVLRAQEHLMNTPRHVALQGALTRLRDDRDAGSGSDGTKFRTPVYAHLPLIFNPDGTKMSKRDKAKAARKSAKDALSKDATLVGDEGAKVAALAGRAGVEAPTLRGFLDAESDSPETAAALGRALGLTLPEIEVWDYRASGYLPEAIVNYLALLGWSPGLKAADGKDVEKFDLAFLCAHFDLERIGKTPAKFDRAKLQSFNGDAIAQLSDEAFVTRLRAWAAQFEPALDAQLAGLAARDPQRLARVVGVAKGRCKTLRDFGRVVAFALVDDEALAFDPAAMAKHLGAGAAAASAPRELLAAFVQTLRAHADQRGAVEPASIDAWIKEQAEQRGMKLGDVAQPLRVALTGGTTSPGLGDVVAILGRASSVRRVERCLGTPVGA